MNDTHKTFQAIYTEKKFQSGNKLFSVVDYPLHPGDTTQSHPDLWIESQDDAGAFSFELESREQLQAIIEHLLAIKDRWKAPSDDISSRPSKTAN